MHKTECTLLNACAKVRFISETCKESGENIPLTGKRRKRHRLRLKLG